MSSEKQRGRDEMTGDGASSRRVESRNCAMKKLQKTAKQSSISITLLQMIHKWGWENEAHEQEDNREGKGFVYWVAESREQHCTRLWRSTQTKQWEQTKEHINFLGLAALWEDGGETPIGGDSAHIKTAVICTQQGSLANKSDANPSPHPAAPAHHNLLRVSFTTARPEQKWLRLGDTFLMFYALVAATALMCFNSSTQSNRTSRFTDWEMLLL